MYLLYFFYSQRINVLMNASTIALNSLCCTSLGVSTVRTPVWHFIASVSHKTCVCSSLVHASWKLSELSVERRRFLEMSRKECRWERKKKKVEAFLRLTKEKEDLGESDKGVRRVVQSLRMRRQSKTKSSSVKVTPTPYSGKCGDLGGD